MSHTKKTPLFILGVASFFGVTWLIRQRRAGIAGLCDWQRTLARRYGAKKAQSNNCRSTPATRLPGQ